MKFSLVLAIHGLGACEDDDDDAGVSVAVASVRTSWRGSAALRAARAHARAVVDMKVELGGRGTRERKERRGRLARAGSDSKIPERSEPS